MLREGKIFDYAHTAEVTKGIPLIIDDFVLMPVNSAKANEFNTYYTEGVFAFDLADAHGLSVGKIAYLVVADNKVTATKGTNKALGRVSAIVGNKAEVKINS